MPSAIITLIFVFPLQALWAVCGYHIWSWVSECFIRRKQDRWSLNWRKSTRLGLVHIRCKVAGRSALLVFRDFCWAFLGIHLALWIRILCLARNRWIGLTEDPFKAKLLYHHVWSVLVTCVMPTSILPTCQSSPDLASCHANHRLQCGAQAIKTVVMVLIFHY